MGPVAPFSPGLPGSPCGRQRAGLRQDITKHNDTCSYFPVLTSLLLTEGPLGPGKPMFPGWPLGPVGPGGPVRPSCPEGPWRRKWVVAQQVMLTIFFEQTST